jgi:hypothetical protein
MSASSPGEGIPAECINRCRKLARFLAAGRITFEEYASNITDTIVYSPMESIPLCVETVPPALVSSYAEYLRTSLEPVDFMPSPSPFLAGDISEEVFHRTKLALRPKYLRLYQLMNDRGRRPRTGTGYERVEVAEHPVKA